jgi:hypothetical protein
MRAGRRASTAVIVVSTSAFASSGSVSQSKVRVKELRSFS